MTVSAFYREIPAVTGCRADCEDCCGGTPMTKGERDAVTKYLRENGKPAVAKEVRKHWAEGLLFVLDASGNPTGKCPVFVDGRCAAYPVRPLMCRLFGAVADEPRLKCPHGATAIFPMTPERAREMTRAYAVRMADE